MTHIAIAEALDGVVVTWMEKVSDAHWKSRRSASPIPGTTKLYRLHENIGSTEIELSADDLSAIETAVTNIEGERYPERLEQLTGL